MSLSSWGGSNEENLRRNNNESNNSSSLKCHGKSMKLPSDDISEICHNYYDKEKIHYILDSYHRECIHIPLSKICNDDDLIILSDLDEILIYIR